MLPIIVIVGRPNVGKSTLFNRLTRSRDAIVHDEPGITRDRHYGRGRVGEKPYLVVDTGGFEPVAADGIYHEMARQTRQAIDEADAVLFTVDGRAGLTAQDEIIATELRKTGRPAWVVVNKTEGMRPEEAAAEFHALGLGHPLPISAAHGENVSDLMEFVLANFPAVQEDDGAVRSSRASPSSGGRTSGNRRSRTRCWAKSASSSSISRAPRAIRFTSISNGGAGPTRSSTRPA